MTEEKVKQIVVDMIASGELAISLSKGHAVNLFSADNTRKKIIMEISHVKNGYRKAIFRTDAIL